MVINVRQEAAIHIIQLFPSESRGKTPLQIIPFWNHTRVN